MSSSFGHPSFKNPKGKEIIDQNVGEDMNISTLSDTEDKTPNRGDASTSKHVLDNKLEKDDLSYDMEETTMRLKEFQEDPAVLEMTRSSNKFKQELRNNLEKDVNYINRTMLKVRNFQDRVDTMMGDLTVSNIHSSTIEQLSSQHSQLKNTILQREIPFLDKIFSKNSQHQHQQLPRPRNDFHDAASNEANIISLDGLYSSQVLRETSIFAVELKEKYDSLVEKEKQCLLCFSVFPEKAVIKKRVLMYWWIGEGFLEDSVSTLDRDFERILDKFVSDGFIEHVYEKRKLKSHGYKLQTFVRPVLTHFSTQNGFMEFDSNGEYPSTSSSSPTRRLCLVKTSSLGGGGSSQQQLLQRSSSSSSRVDLANVKTLFNINETILNLRRDHFSKLRGVQVLQLGTWQCSTMHHVEVENSEFLKGLKDMKRLKYLSFQGISGIKRLPSKCIKGLKDLTVLDLSACHHLEELPHDAISSLTNLTHLDLSECYLLSSIPTGLSSLRQLQVLKGFVITDNKVDGMCMLNHLTRLTNLRKLSIYIYQRVENTMIITDDEIKSLDKIESLEKLKLTWLRAPNPKPMVISVSEFMSTREVEQPRPPPPTDDYPSLLTHPRLEKLDLRGFPEFSLAKWLLPAVGSVRSSLKKLYIRGGKLQHLSISLSSPWTNVEILRLKFLNDLRMNWSRLQFYFPSLRYLEKVNCPNLAYFPCDKLGVWQKNRD